MVTLARGKHPPRIVQLDGRGWKWQVVWPGSLLPGPAGILFTSRLRGAAIYRSASLHSTLERTQQYTLFLQLIPTSRQCLSSSRGSSPLALSPIFSGLPPPKKIGVPVLFRSLLFLHRTVTNSKQPVVVNNTLQSAYSSPTKQTHSVFLYTANFLPTCITIPDYKPVEIYVHYIKI